MQGHHQDLQTEALVGRAVSPRTNRRKVTRTEVEGTAIVEEIGTGAAAKDIAAPLRPALLFGAQIVSGLRPSCPRAAMPNATFAIKR